MTATTAALRREIASAAELGSVVRTMKALAASSIGQYQASVRALAEYHETIALGLGACFRLREPTPPAGVTRAPSRPVAAVVFGSDQGLVGRFNEVVASEALAALGALPRPAHVWAVGERVEARLVDAGVEVSGRFDVPTSVDAIRPLVARLLVAVLGDGVVDDGAELHLFYNRPTAEAGYAASTERLLPLDDAWRREIVRLPWPTKQRPEVFGDGVDTLRALLREHLFISLFRASAESLASENASRLAAMERAEKNIEERLDALHDELHRWRQRSIDEELFDVVSGFEALSAERRGARARGTRR